jgi:DNA replication protein DnaC
VVSLYKTCDVCHRKEFFRTLPTQQQEAFTAEIVRPRYIEALPEHISPGLWTQLMGASDKGAYLWGKPGVGKTYALAAMARLFISEGFLVKRITFEKLCLLIRDTFRPDSGRSTWQIIEPYVECDRLILEDVSVAVSEGKQESDFSLRTLLVILDERSEECKATFISGNKPPTELGKAFDERISSRLKQGAIIKVTGDDRRG